MHFVMLLLRLEVPGLVGLRFNYTERKSYDKKSEYYLSGLWLRRMRAAEPAENFGITFCLNNPPYEQAFLSQIVRGLVLVLRNSALIGVTTRTVPTS